VRKIKVLIANRPRLMRELIVATISDQSDIEVVGVLEEEASIPKMVEQSQPDVLRSSTSRLLAVYRLCVCKRAPAGSMRFFFEVQAVRLLQMHHSTINTFPVGKVWLKGNTAFFRS
jgi:DNA-binding NarL/FixJ family response regulator